MQIGTLKINTPVILAPMAGITDLPYRTVMQRFGAGLVVSEMVSAKGLIHAGIRTRELLRSSLEERPLAIQLFGSEPADLATAARLVENDGELIDLNLGCPVNKVVRSGAGSALLREPDRVRAIVRAVRQATDLPLTVKIRSGWDQNSVNFIEIGRIVQEEGADALTLHPRTRSQGFAGRADWEHLHTLKQAVNIPVIGSGDVFSAADARAMIEQTGCDAVMIGRGSYGNPWLIRDVARALTGALPLAAPTPDERHQVALDHLELQVAFSGESKALFEMRKHLCWYVRGLKGAAGFRATINRTTTLDAQRALLQQFFADVEADTDDRHVA